MLTIAHRLQTVMDSDLLLVLAGGRVREVGAPAALLADSASAFHAMVNQH